MNPATVFVDVREGADGI
jgi:hypothetical protein